MRPTSPRLFLVLLLCGCASGSAPRPIDESDLVVLGGNVHPLAKPELRVGHAPPALPMQRMILSLMLHPEQQARLDALLARQQDPASPDFHRWLTPEEFGQQFGPSAEELAQVTGWLAGHGLAVEEIGAGRMWVNFSGPVADVEAAFHTTIDDYAIDGAIRHANSVAPSIPRALAGRVAGAVSLHNLPRRAMNTGFRRGERGERSHPDNTGSDGSHAMAAGDFATIYNVAPLYAAGVTGTGRTLAVVARTHPAASNWSTFRTKMGLPANAPQVVLNGTDPGDLGADEDGEADLDVEWSGAVAKAATVKFVVSASTASTDGVDLSAQYIVDKDLADVMTTSFGSCEADMGSAENTFFNNLWAQAASQGITAFVSTGDSGVAGCNGGNDTTGKGKAVSGLASTPNDVAVGGTMFSDSPVGTYWNSTNGSDLSSAKGYIPEVAWNESGSQTSCPAGDTCSGLWATSGGVSTLYSKPTWQAGLSALSGNFRGIPDVSLSAASYDGYLVYTQGAFYLTGGTSASSPSFAGLMTLIVQKTGQRQGNANPRLYALGAAQYSAGGPAVFHDTKAGNNTVPGVTGYSCGTGYDLATGLGSVDANALATNWVAGANADFGIAASPVAASVAQGGTGTSTITTTLTGSFNHAVALTTSQLPSGVSASFSPGTIAAPGSGTSTLTFTAGSSATTGTTTVTVTGTAGTTVHTSTITLTVTTAGSSDFSVSASPAAISLPQGGSGTSTITTTISGGFNHAVALSASTLPAQATAFFSPSSVAAPGSGTSTLTLAAGAGTPAGVYNVTITGDGGSAQHTASITLTVTAPSASCTAFSDGFEGASFSGWTADIPSGSTAAWTQVAAGADPVSSPHGGANLADFNAYDANTGDEAFLHHTAGFAMPAAGACSGMALTFWVFHDTDYCDYPDSIQARVSTDGQAWTSVGSAQIRCDGSSGWKQATADLGAYAGAASLQVGFLGHSEYGNDMYLDDVVVSGSAVVVQAFAISGKVTFGGAGLAGVTVVAGSATATTAADGTYALAGLANGTYSVTPSLAGYTFSPASASTAVNGADVAGVNFTAAAVASTFSIAGTITLGSAGLPGVTVSAGSASATTNSTGAYTITGLANGTYTVTPALAGYTFSPANRSVAVSGANVGAINFGAVAVPVTYSLSGSITSGGSGLAGVTVTAGSGTATTGAAGTYTITGLANGSYTVTPTLSGYTFTPPSRSVAVSGANATGADFTATAVVATTYTIAGTITLGGVGLKAVTVAVLGASATTAADGTYTLTGLANGSYTITPSLAGYTFSPASRPATVSGANLTGMDFTATAGGPTTFSLSGTVTLAAAGLAGVTVSAGVATATTAADGTYTINGLANAAYTITPSLDGYAFAPGSRAVTVSGANATGADFKATAVSPGGGGGGGVAIAPATAATTPKGTLAFTASGGSGTGYIWSLATNASGGSISSSGAYQAGASGGVVDSVQVKDSLGAVATRAVIVGAGVSVVPGAVFAEPGSSVAFSARGGSGSGYTWSLSINGSGGTIDAATGAYVAGQTQGVDDEVQATDALGNTGTASVTLSVAVATGKSGGCGTGGGADLSGVVLGLAALLRGLRTRARPRA